jgi:benzoyl-CoA reductase/2-hydroxyglutaryl-CoA dehydratase subunit BcrC/BadD/HgdB
MNVDRPLGPRVGLFSAYVPRELLYGLGCSPVRIFPSAAKPTAAEALLPRNFCALLRLTLAGFLEEGDLGLEGVIFADEDDAARRLHDVWRANVSVPVWDFVEVPRLANTLAFDYYAGILVRAGAELEARAGHPLTVAGLRQSIGLYNEQRSILKGLKQQWLAGRLDTVAYRRLRRNALSQEPAAANEHLAEVLGEMAGDEGAAAAPRAAGAPRLLLLAELAAPAGLVRLVEAHGARVVAEDSDLDEREVAGPVPTEADRVEGLLRNLAQAYLSKPPSPRMRDLPRRFDYLSQLVAERGVQAAICAYSKFCDLFLAEFPSLKAHLEDLGVPVLLLELEDEAISGQHRTRVEAFLEMI